MLSNNATILRDEYGFDVAAARETLVRLADVVPGELVLDVGTGLGSLAIVLAQHGLMVDAVDINLQSLDEARQRALATGVDTYQRIRFLQADGLRLPFGDRQYAGVFSFDSLHHMPDCPAAIAELIRACAIGGVLALADLNEAGTHAVDEVLARGGQQHFHNACQVDVTAQVLESRGMVFQRHPLEFVTIFLARVSDTPSHEGTS
ncbi:MAG: methyltransferase domain-containing protein [Pirellulaceae bacterium]|nr:methyltransferase domain-containing protein [Pirellulaceae bacterium]